MRLPLPTTCPQCGTPVVGAARFCVECGERLAPAGDGTGLTVAHHPGTASGLPGGAERRSVTVLFVDLVGFTSLAKGRDAETVRDLLSRYFETASEIVRRYGGRSRRTMNP